VVGVTVLLVSLTATAFVALVMLGVFYEGSWLRPALRAAVARMRGAHAAEQLAMWESAITQLSVLSGALRASGGGTLSLQQSLVEAAAEIAGPHGAAILLVREGSGLLPRAAHGIVSEVAGLDDGIVPRLLSGELVRVRPPHGSSPRGLVLGLPMSYEEKVVGALVVYGGSRRRPRNVDVQRLTLLAYFGATALETMRYLDAERATARRIRRTAVDKSRSLTSLQGSLGGLRDAVPTRVAAALGMCTVLDMSWTAWDDQEKVAALGEIRWALRTLLVSITEFSIWLGDGPRRDVVPSNGGHELVGTVASREEGPQVPTARADGSDELDVADYNGLRDVIESLLGGVAPFAPEGMRLRVGGLMNGLGGRARMKGEATFVGSGVGRRAELVRLSFKR
jgi:hypothetical protein